MVLQSYAEISLLLSVAVSGVLAILYVVKREKIFLPWLITWSLLALHFTFQVVHLGSGSYWAWVLNRWSSVLASLGLVYAAREYAGLPRRRAILILIALAAGAWTIYHATIWPPVGDAHGPSL